MKPIDHSLARLLRAAARAPQPAPAPMPSGLAQRILRDWRQTRPQPTDFELLVRWCRQGLALACALSLVLITISLLERSTHRPDAWGFASSLTQLAWTP